MEEIKTDIPVLSVRNFSKTYRGGKRAVEDLSLDICAGDIFGFIGPNGAGKTTTLKAVSGILDFKVGEIRICGHSIQEEPLWCKERMAYLPDNPDLYEYLTGIQYLNFIGDVYRVPGALRTQRIGELAERFGITRSLGDLISAYSHGMKQKLALISAFLHSPRLLLLDEPFVGLDPEASVMLKESMHALCREGGAIFFSTHVLEVAQKLCNRIAIIREGRLVAQGETEALTAGKSLEEVFMEVAHNERD
ncbi:MAG TPA: ABC transporter ATP-binding protein [Candidatus Eisenbergiella merdipullorum]|uniref:ABC transporter ATP-binding protein n=1 Tax=Candidatus Eisenbergiella merdipullorum TaxID=2838553 RepID=A0A9D2I405_9FIRM|nr:ABC transporter ATP-binding protein [Candidatus Eisenbergiella merdipullorum]